MPTSLRPLREMLTEYMNAGLLDEAARTLRELERRDPKGCARWAQRLGDVERRRGRTAHAAVAYQRAAGAYKRSGHPEWAVALQATASGLR